MTRLLLALFCAVSIAQAAYSQTAPAPAAPKILQDPKDALQETKDLVERLKPETREMASRAWKHHYDETRGKIGFMSYCAEKQLLDPETAKQAAHTYTRSVDVLFHDKETASHRAYDRQSGDEAERQGALGIMYDKDWMELLVHMGPRLHPHGKSLYDYANDKGVTPTALCKQWADEASAYERALANRQTR
jgi:hypothetical protein